MKKAGFKAPKLGSEQILYICVLIIFMVFIFNMKGIYNMVSDIKTGNLFKKVPTVSIPSTDSNSNNSSNKNDTTNNDTTTTEKYDIVKPIGDNSLKCTLVTDSASGSRKTEVYLYFTGDSLKSLDEEVTYEGQSDEYTNYIYSEKSRYETRKKNNKKLSGYSVVVSLSGTLSLKTSSVIDLSKVKLTDLTLGENDNLGLAGEYDQNVIDVENIYASAGYECE